MPQSQHVMRVTPGQIARVSARLFAAGMPSYPQPALSRDGLVHSVVAFLLRPGSSGMELLLTRRSRQVRQPGDLCCPGGAPEPVLDGAAARLLLLPGSPLTRWPWWRRWRRDTGAGGRVLAHFMATALRECFEEIRLRPLGTRFLGMLPPQELVLFKRAIYPVVCWVPRQRRFRPNWEVDAMVSIPVSRLLTAEGYVCYRLRFDAGVRHPTAGAAAKDFTGFRYADGTDDTEILWGATFRMAMDYLRIVHGFTPPPAAALPVVTRTIGSDYLTGNGPQEPDGGRRTADDRGQMTDGR
jgi:8-oxo-dGTP pyrophosphatase MutT (NUDIX family)